ncbi:hypothetical protein HOLleu_34820 [Holothuria leucospilota]|uniref:Uncharacterized protein n=1 Tax=Holothuria leucospilota TaxID=206669 RepID=A0A9Q0YLX2_HOLLE|nr:hypothetical protein HOLleu_34820 [Holothuria leucospilota]
MTTTTVAVAVALALAMAMAMAMVMAMAMTMTMTMTMMMLTTATTTTTMMLHFYIALLISGRSQSALQTSITIMWFLTVLKPLATILTSAAIVALQFKFKQDLMMSTKRKGNRSLF